jgi:hypothetical protein
MIYTYVCIVDASTAGWVVRVFSWLLTADGDEGDEKITIIGHSYQT